MLTRVVPLVALAGCAAAPPAEPTRVNQRLGGGATSDEKFVVFYLGIALGLLGAAILAALALNLADWIAAGDYVSLFKRAAIALVLIFLAVRMVRNSRLTRQ